MEKIEKELSSGPLKITLIQNDDRTFTVTTNNKQRWDARSLDEFVSAISYLLVEAVTGACRHDVTRLELLNAMIKEISGRIMFAYEVVTNGTDTPIIRINGLQ